MTTTTTTGRRRRASLAAAALTGVTLLALAACSTPAPQVTPPPVTLGPTITPEKSAAPTPEVPPTWPLTGVEGQTVERPSLAVKIENTVIARPQSGLDEADVVWETIVEFEVSRFIAVFHSKVPDEVGPIRSVRPMDPVILAPTQGMLAFSGGQPGILRLASNSGLQILSHDAGAPGMYRISTRAAPHNVYGSPETFWEQADADHSDSPPEQFAFARSADRATAVVQGEAAKTLAFRLSAASSPSWTWDGEHWLRSEGSTPATDQDGDRLQAVNVVSITAPHPDSGFDAQGGAPVPTYDLVGEGKGVIATGGKTTAVTWKKESEDAPLLLFKGGKPALLAPGNTWVELVPKGSGSLSIS